MPEIEAIATGPQAAPEHAHRVVRRLLSADQHLPDETREGILALGDGALPELMQIMENDELALSVAPGHGWAPTHAARLLGEMGATQAVEPMLRVLAATDWQEILHDQVIQSLPKIGAPVIEPALRAFAESEDPNFRDSLAVVLAEAGVHDDRIFTILIDQLRGDPSRAGNLAAYGDSRAVPHLLKALDDYRIVEGDSPLANQDLVELRAAIEELGGSLSPAQDEKYVRALAPAEWWRQQMQAAMESRQPTRRRDRPGRNDPCWCGSKKKYKKCHLAADESGASTEVSRS